jgi:hypothetical protein
MNSAALENWKKGILSCRYLNWKDWVRGRLDCLIVPPFSRLNVVVVTTQDKKREKEMNK